MLNVPVKVNVNFNLFPHVVVYLLHVVAILLGTHVRAIALATVAYNLAILVTGRKHQIPPEGKFNDY